MKKLLLIALMGSISNLSFAQEGYPDMYEPEVFNRNPAAVQPPPPPPPPLPYMSGVYVGVNAGYTYLQSTYSRRYNGVDVVWALSHPNWNWNTGNINPVLGFDFFSRCQVPVRLELSGTWYRNGSHQQNGVLVLPTGVAAGFNQYANDKIKAWSLLANFYIDWRNPLYFTPYMGVGAGAARIQTTHSGYLIGPVFGPFGPGSSETFKWSQTHFAWNAILGVNYEVTPNFSIQLQGTYTDLGKVNFIPHNVFYYTRHLQAYNADIGIRWSFFC